MSNFDKDNQYSLIVGMGATGFSIARFLDKKGERFEFFDTRAPSIFVEKFDSAFPSAKKHFVSLNDDVILNSNEIYLSPGVSRSESIVTKAIKSGKSVVGDIELFLREVEKPVIGITGSNGKSTVTTLVALAAEHANIDVAVGGNIGTPALDLLNQEAELYVLELSSFQLESTYSPTLAVACNLNISVDHMDRYDTLNEYVMAKQRIFNGAKHAIYALDDPLTIPTKVDNQKRYGFGLNLGNDVDEKQFVFCPESGFLKTGEYKLISKEDINIKGIHNIKNALALFAIADAAGIDVSACRSVLKSFGGLPHRCEVVLEEKAITYINDSKATNVGATQAAIQGLAPEFGSIVLIAGGDGKGADFSDLTKSINQSVRVLVLIGVDAPEIAANINSFVDIINATDMQEAVRVARTKAFSGDVVLLSPACASLDMYDNFEERGADFIRCVKSEGGVEYAS